MQATTIIEHDTGLCVWRISGIATLEHLQASYLERFDLPGWWPEIHNLTVLTEAKLERFTPATAESLMRFMAVAAARNGVKTGFYAAIVCADPDNRAMLSYWDRRAPAGLSGENRTFGDEATARAWLSSQT